MEDIQLITKIKSATSSYEVYTLSSIEILIKQIIEIQPSIIFIDKNVFNLHEKLQVLQNVELFDSIEENKYYEISIKILDVFTTYNLKKNSKILVIGGGIIQDMIGYCCSIYARGIPYYLVPTTLLSQCDSCIGGKTSINFKNKKNLIGTFYPPIEIILCSDFINTLSNEDFLSGLGEVFKFNCLQNNIENFCSMFPLYQKRQNINLLVKECIQYKSKIIEIDEFDQNERKFLNFGHTFGHALESTSSFKIPHGSGVVMGIVLAYWISNFFNFIEDKKAILVQDISFNLVNNLKVELNWFDFDLLLPCIKSDKKNTGQIVMVLPKDDGFVLEKIEEDKLKIAYIYAFEKLSKIVKLQ